MDRIQKSKLITKPSKRKGKVKSIPSSKSSTPPSTYTTSTRDEFITSCSDDDAYNIIYNQAGWCYYNGLPTNFIMTHGNIFIEGQPSSNPLACTGDEIDTLENCIVPMGTQDNWTGSDDMDCEYPCNTDANCPEV